LPVRGPIDGAPLLEEAAGGEKEKLSKKKKEDAACSVHERAGLERAGSTGPKTWAEQEDGARRV
jgi:hypothetical protein